MNRTLLTVMPLVLALCSPSFIAPNVQAGSGPLSQDAAAAGREQSSVASQLEAAPSAEKAAGGDGATSDSGTPSATAESEAEPEKFLLRYVFHPGQTLRYETRQSQTMEAMVQEHRKTDRSEVLQRRVYTVRDLDDQNTAHLTMQFEYVRMQVQADQQPSVVFESTMTDQQIPPMFRMAAARLKGSAPNYWLMPSGRSKLPAEEVARLKAAQTAKTAQKPLIGGTESDGASAAGDDQKEDTHTFLVPLPEHPVAVGETWKEFRSVKVRVTQEIQRSIEILQTYRLKSVDNGIAQITFTSSIMSPVKSPVIRAQLMQSCPKGSLKLDLSRGLLIRKEMRFDETVLHAMGENTAVTSFGHYLDELLPLTTKTEEPVSQNSVEASESRVAAQSAR